MRFYVFDSVKSQHGRLLTLEGYLKLAYSKQVQKLALQIGDCKDETKKANMKKLLPIITWQAAFKDGRRTNATAEPSGLYMVDYDHVEDVKGLMKKALDMKAELGIVYIGKSISGTGVRIVAECRPEYTTIAECQHWISDKLGQKCDEACKDWARSSFVVPAQYEYYFDQGVFEREAKIRYEAVPAVRMGARATGRGPSAGVQKVTGGAAGRAAGAAAELPRTEPGTKNEAAGGGAAAGVKAEQTTYYGIPLREIAEAWIAENGGTPEIGVRHNTLMKIATKMRYICDFNPATICANIPHFDKPEAEVMDICRYACSTSHSSEVPEDIRRLVARLQNQAAAEETAEAAAEEDYETERPAEPMPLLPPIFKEWAAVAPNDFKSAVVLCLLPMLGTLGSKLRGYYASGKSETPTFQVTLEAGQAQGKSFIERVCDRVMRPLKEKDEAEQALERQYQEEDQAMNTRTSTKAEREEHKKKVASRRQPIIREMGVSASMTKVLKRMEAAQGLHLFAMAVELDTVAKSFSRGFSNLSDFLRAGFDNSVYSQDYASDTSWSGKVRVYYNLLYSGTPGAVGSFFNNKEDGTMSRTLFVTFPDQFGRRMPIWRNFTAEEDQELERHIMRLYNVSIEGDEVKEPHWMDLSFLSDAMYAWTEKQRHLSIAAHDQTRNTYQRRCAEVGFRAGMLAHFLWEEDSSEEGRERVVEFSTWVAEKMLMQFLVRVNDEDISKSNINPSNLFKSLPNTFTREQLEKCLMSLGRKNSTQNTLSTWLRRGKIKPYGRETTEFVKNR